MSDLESSADTVGTWISYEMGNLSPPESPSTIGDSGGDVIGDSKTTHGGPELHQWLAEEIGG